MCKCQHYQKHSAITPVIAFQHSWQAELSCYSVFTIWLWSHFHAGHGCTKTACVLHYKDIWFFNEQESKLCWGFFFLRPPLPSKRRPHKRMQGDYTKTVSVQRLFMALKDTLYKMKHITVTCTLKAVQFLFDRSRMCLGSKFQREETTLSTQARCLVLSGGHRKEERRLHGGLWWWSRSVSWFTWCSKERLLSKKNVSEFADVWGGGQSGDVDGEAEVVFGEGDDEHDHVWFI